jgi:hypothetical protein
MKRTTLQERHHAIRNTKYVLRNMQSGCIWHEGVETGIMARRKLTRNEKIFYAVSLLIIFSMVFSIFASLIATPF